MNEQNQPKLDQRGCKVLYKEKEYLVDMSLEKFKKLQEEHPNIDIRLFWKEPFYDENSIGPVTVSELTLPVE